MSVRGRRWRRVKRWGMIWGPIAWLNSKRCSLHPRSFILAMWGFHDHSLSMRKALNETMITSKPNNSLYRRWRWAQSVQNKKVRHGIFPSVLSSIDFSMDWSSLNKNGTKSGKVYCDCHPPSHVFRKRIQRPTHRMWRNARLSRIASWEAKRNGWSDRFLEAIAASRRKRWPRSIPAARRNLHRKRHGNTMKVSKSFMFMSWRTIFVGRLLSTPIQYCEPMMAKPFHRSNSVESICHWVRRVEFFLANIVRFSCVPEIPPEKCHKQPVSQILLIWLTEFLYRLGVSGIWCRSLFCSGTDGTQ